MPFLVFAQEKQLKKKSTRPTGLESDAQLKEESKPDFSKESLFKGIFEAGLNISQVDGDQEFGYRKFGAMAGVGTYVKFHKYLSTSLEIVYDMEGAKPRYKTFENGKKNYFDITTDYVHIPISLNVHDKRIVMAGVGLSFGALVRYKESALDSVNRDLTHYSGTVKTLYGKEYEYQAPRRFDLSFQAHASFVIKEQFTIGIRFMYSLLRTRDAVNTDKIKGQYNNVITVRFSYLLDPKKMKLKKR